MFPKRWKLFVKTSFEKVQRQELTKYILPLKRAHGVKRYEITNEMVVQWAKIRNCDGHHNNFLCLLEMSK